MPNANDATTITSGTGNPPLPGLSQDPSCVEFTTGAAGTAPAATNRRFNQFNHPPPVSRVILNGVGTTFALTLPSPGSDGEECEVMFVTAVSTAFSCSVTAPATTVKGVPSTQGANTGIAFFYHAADATWYRKY
jgi:hypothetical protein